MSTTNERPPAGTGGDPAAGPVAGPARPPEPERPPDPEDRADRPVMPYWVAPDDVGDGD